MPAEMLPVPLSLTKHYLSHARSLGEEARMSELIVAAVGDSVMWGQGLNDADKFVKKSAVAIGSLVGREPIVRWFPARSGAKIVVSDNKERERFINRYPTLFRSQQDRDDFLAGNEEKATLLHGEVPCSLPSVMYQLARMDPALSESTNILLICGGANDIDFQKLLSSDEKDFSKIMDPVFRETFYEKMRLLLATARIKCPNAVIMLIGYYSAFSEKSSGDDIKDMFVSLQGETPIGLALNAVVNPLSLGHLGVDLDRKVRDAKARSRYGASRGFYWSRKIVAEINEEFRDISGPGLIFVHPGFRDENSMFAGQSFIHQQYEKVNDDASDIRRANCPRVEHLKAMENIRSMYQNQQRPVFIPTKDQLRELRREMDGPTSLLAVLDGLIKNPTNTRLFKPAIAELSDEISRIKRCLVASLVHPNSRGGAQYANAIVERYARYRKGEVRRNITELSGKTGACAAAGTSVRDSLRRYGLRPETGLRACLQHVLVDSVAVEITTELNTSTSPTSGLATPSPTSGLATPSPTSGLATPSPGVIPASDEIFIVLGGKSRWRLRHRTGLPNPHFRTGARDFFTIDTFGSLRLGDVTELTLQREGTAQGEWTPRSINLYINGHEVFSGAVGRPLRSGESLGLPYPAASVSSFPHLC